MANMTLTPTNIQRAVNDVENYVLKDTQVFWAENGAVIITDDEVYEVYLYSGNPVVQVQGLAHADGWQDVSDIVLV